MRDDAFDNELCTVEPHLLGVSPGELQSPGTGPFIGSMAHTLRKIVGRKHGPVPFALDFAVLLQSKKFLTRYLVPLQ